MKQILVAVFVFFILSSCLIADDLERFQALKARGETNPIILSGQGHYRVVTSKWGYWPEVLFGEQTDDVWVYFNINQQRVEVTQTITKMDTPHPQENWPIGVRDKVIAVRDGNTYQLYSANNKCLITGEFGSESSQVAQSYLSSYNYLNFLSIYSFKKRSDTKTDGVSRVDLGTTILSNETINGKDCMVGVNTIQCTRDPKKGLYLEKETVWLAQDSGLPTKFLVERVGPGWPNNSVAVRSEIIAYQRDKQGTWYPTAKEVTINSCSYGDTMVKERIIEKFTVLEEFRVNIEIPPEKFSATIVVPKGTTVRAQPVHAAEPEVFIKHPRPGVRISASTFYVCAEGLDLCCVYSEQTSSDKTDAACRMFSNDNGLTWGPAEPLVTNGKTGGGVLRRGLHPGFADTGTGTLLTMINQAVLPTDSPLEGMKHWTLRYALSRDGGRTFFHEEPVVHAGHEFSPEHPLPGVWTGRNAAMIGDISCRPIRLSTGEILQPVQITPVGPDGEYNNPGGGYTYHDSAVLIGKWNTRGTLDWRMSALVKGDPKRSTRGVLEPTIAELPDGRILMVLRGSNDARPELPGRRWYSVSRDHGRTWSRPEAWRYAEGPSFFSPSSCSQLLRHANGRIYWIGNISETNPKGNSPRYPLVIGEVDRRTLLLKRSSLLVIAGRATGDTDRLALSNFLAREDRETGEIVIHCSPVGRLSNPGTPPGAFDWTADALVYRVRP